MIAIRMLCPRGLERDDRTQRRSTNRSMASENNTGASFAVLIDALARGEDDARERAYEQLLEEAQERGEEAVDALIEAMAHTDREIREAASAILGEMGEPVFERASEIANSLRDPDPTVRGNAALILSQAGEAAVATLPHLRDALEIEEDDWASAIILDAVTKIERV